jgi:hypothetical protein
MDAAPRSHSPLSIPPLETAGPRAVFGTDKGTIAIFAAR